ncbi:MAG: 3-deoxy-8-phosphooctulonate synthase, partial [Candidatus Aminicenantes bacterium]|nr:3-deoxy-8-phosphooctulonate synthase [Candidatus Aminicenantes bacterium]
ELNKEKFFTILGPCVIESEKMTLQIAESIKDISEELNIDVIFKASFDKANRSSIDSYRGPGIDEGLRILKKVKDELELPVLSDIHEPQQAVQAAEVLDIIQIPAFLCRQTDLLTAAGETGLPVNVKKSQFMAPEDMEFVAGKIRSTGNANILLTERGTFFGYRNLVVDIRNIPVMKKTGYPVIIDATHSVQRPTAANGVTGGNPEFIPLIAGAGLLAGADGVFIEVHPDPQNALSDGANSLDLKKLKLLLIRLEKIYNIT